MFGAGRNFLPNADAFLGRFRVWRLSLTIASRTESKTVARWHVTATHTGDALGFPATNRKVAFRGMTWLEFKDGRIVRGWDSWNLGGLLQSLSA